MITKSEVKENLSIFTKTFSIIPWETHLVLSARLNSSKIDSDIILTLAPKSAIAFMLNISTEQGIVKLHGFGFSVDEGFYDGDLNGPYIWYSAIVISSALIPTPGAWFCVSSRYCSIVRSLMSTTSMMFPREYIEVEFFEGWKPLSPLQLAVEEGEQGIVMLEGKGWFLYLMVDRDFYDGDLNGPCVWYSVMVISSTFLGLAGSDGDDIGRGGDSGSGDSNRGSGGEGI
ncbi:hypothetical protein Tco_0017869 [Tanacetum coccineum]